jgi:outer membrane protein OmpA-like peptidoglycan-associated protein
MVNVFKEIYRSLRFYYLVRYRPPEFAGMHYVRITQQLPGRDTVSAYTQYDRSDIPPWAKDSQFVFYKRILFDYNQSIIKPESYRLIEELVDQLQRYDRVWLEVQGHTDNIGGEEFNKNLSLARALAVVKALAERGVDAKRLVPRGMGMMYPLVSNDTEEGRTANRRTQFVVIRQ